jgi:hypothetical protein
VLADKAEERGFSRPSGSGDLGAALRATNQAGGREAGSKKTWGSVACVRRASGRMQHRRAGRGPLASCDGSARIPTLDG